MVSATIFKVKTIAFQVFCDFFFFFGAIGSFQNFKTIDVKAFFFSFFKRKSTDFGSQGRTGCGRSAVVYILLYGFIYFIFYCANQLEDFFSSAISDLFLCFFLPRIYLPLSF